MSADATDWWGGLSDGRRASIHQWLTQAHTRKAVQVDGQLEGDQWVLFVPSDIPTQPAEVRSADYWWDTLAADRRHSIHRWLVHGEPMSAEVRGQLTGLVEAP